MEHSLGDKAILALKVIQQKVDEQSNDPWIWLSTNQVQVRKIQKELRALHDVIERFTIAMFEKSNLLN